MLSVVICTYNEEKNLKRIVDSVRDFADEIVVVDTESGDQTVELARNLGCKVYHHKHTGIIEPVRNFAVAKAKHNWILLLDADEEVSVKLADEIKQVLRKPQADYYRIPRKNMIFGKWIKSDHWWPDYTYRLFKKGSLVWKDEIHSLPETRGIGQNLESPIIHHNYQTVSQYLKKMDTYTDFQSREITKTGISFHWSFLLTKPSSEFIRQYYSRKGYQDGIHGLVLAILQSFSEFVVCTKVWQSQDFFPQEISSVDLDMNLSGIRKEYSWWKQEVLIQTSTPLNSLLLKLKRKVLS